VDKHLYKGTDWGNDETLKWAAALFTIWSVTSVRSK